MPNKSNFTPESPEEVGIQHGTPSLAMLPMANFKFSLDESLHHITVPRRGSYKDLDPEFFSEEDGEFCLYDKKSNIMWLPSIQKVLVATKQYPDMEPNQMFVLLSLQFSKDEVEIVGQVIEMLMP